MSEGLVAETFSALDNCTQQVESQLLSRLTPVEDKRPSRKDLTFALELVNKANKLLSQKANGIRKLQEGTKKQKDEWDSGKTKDSVYRMVGVVFAAFRLLYGSREIAGFSPLAIERTMTTFTTLCVNARLGIWDVLVFLRQCLLAHAKHHVMANDRSMKKPVGNRERQHKPASEQPRLEDSCPLLFPIRYCTSNISFDVIIVTLLSNFLRLLVRSPKLASEYIPTLSADHTDGPFSWCVKTFGFDSASVDQFVVSCFRSYYDLGSSGSSKHNLRIRCLAFRLYARTKNCVPKDLIKYIRNTAIRHDPGHGNMSELVEYYSDLLSDVMPLISQCKIGIELSDLCLHLSTVFPSLGPCHNILERMDADDDLVKLIGVMLQINVNIASGDDVHSLSEKFRDIINCVVGPKSKNTLPIWEALVSFANGIRRTTKTAVTKYLRERAEASNAYCILTGIARSLDQCSHIFEMYIARGAAAKSEALGSSNSVLDWHNVIAENRILIIQISLQCPETCKEFIIKHNDLLMTMYEKDKCSVDLLRTHSTLFFNRGAACYKDGIYSDAANYMIIAAKSLTMWIERSKSDFIDENIVSQLCKRYEVAASALQCRGDIKEAANVCERAVKWIVRHFYKDLGNVISDHVSQSLIVIPPYSMPTESKMSKYPGAKASIDHIVRFIERYVSLCAPLLQRDSSQKATAIIEVSSDLESSNNLLYAWLLELEAHLWRPYITQATMTTLQNVRRRILENAAAIYESISSSLGYSRCIAELAKIDRDCGDPKMCIEKLEMSIEVTKNLDPSCLYAVDVLCSGFAWRAILEIEQGKSAAQYIGTCVQLWCTLEKLNLDSVVDLGVIRNSVDMMEFLADLLLSRLMLVWHREVLSIMRKVSVACEEIDISWTRTTIKCLINLGIADLRLGYIQKAMEWFQIASSKYDLGVLPVHTEAEFKITYATSLIMYGNLNTSTILLDGAGQTLQLKKKDRLELLKKRTSSDPKTLVLLSRAAFAYSLLKLKLGSISDAIKYGIHAYRVIYSLIKTLAVAYKNRPTDSEEDPFSESNDKEESSDELVALSFDGNWELQHILVTIVLHLVDIYACQGSIRESDYFLKKGIEIAEYISAPLVKIQFLVRSADLLSRKHLSDKSTAILSEINGNNDSFSDAEIGLFEAATNLIINGDVHRRSGEISNSNETYNCAASLLKKTTGTHYVDVCTSLESLVITPRLKRIVSQVKIDLLSPIRHVKSETSALVDPIQVLKEDLAMRKNFITAVDESLGPFEGTIDLDYASSLRTIDTKPEYLLMQATVMFIEVQKLLETDEPSWSLVLKSTLINPCFSKQRTQKPRKGTAKALIKSNLAEIEEVLFDSCEAALTVGSPHTVHESCHLLALVKSIQNAFGFSEGAGHLIADIIDTSKNITAIREAVEAVGRKKTGVPDIAEWPVDVVEGSHAYNTKDSLEETSSEVLKSSPVAPRKMGKRVELGRGSPEMLLPSLGDLSLIEDEPESGGYDYLFDNAFDLKDAVSKWRQSDTTVSNSISELLPESWTVCGISVDRGRNIMWVTRYQNTKDPVVICLPMRGFDDEQGCAFDGAHKALSEIIEQSNQSMKTGSLCDTEAKKRRWWESRAALDTQMGEVLAQIEDEWLGGFRGILSPTNMLDFDISDEDFGKFCKDIKKCIIGCIPRQYMQKAKQIEISDLVYCLILSISCKKDAVSASDWEDVCSMLLDIYHYQGAAPECDESTLSKLVEELREVLLSLSERIREEPECKIQRKQHLILVLDKHAQQIPWECIPCLRDHPISRIPSITFLKHRISLMRDQSWSSTTSNSLFNRRMFEPLDRHNADIDGLCSGIELSPAPKLRNLKNDVGIGLFKESDQHTLSTYEHSRRYRGTNSTFKPTIDINGSSGKLSKYPSDRAGIHINGENVFYTLNPEGDLYRTQANFEEYLKSHPQWTGVIGRKPMNREIEQGLLSNDIFLYFGHGGAEGYVTKSQIHGLGRCAVALLVGCSSGCLKFSGEFDAMGTAMDYMVGGCPALMANLWDVGDKDIDRFTTQMLRIWGLERYSPNKINVKVDSVESCGPVSLAEAVCLARKSCRMPFLTGAAPVVYGIPAYLE